MANVDDIRNRLNFVSQSLTGIKALTDVMSDAEPWPGSHRPDAPFQWVAVIDLLSEVCLEKMESIRDDLRKLELAGEVAK